MRRLAITLVLLLAGVAQAEWQPDAADSLQVEAAAAIDRVKTKFADEIGMYFDQAHAYAVFPRIRGGGIIFGWNGGQGVVVEGDQFIGHAQQRRLSLGAQLGYQVEAQIIFFRDAASLESFKKGNIEFTPQASANAGSKGGAANAGFSRSVAVFSVTDGGFMLEAAAGGTKYRFRPAR